MRSIGWDSPKKRPESLFSPTPAPLRGHGMKTARARTRTRTLPNSSLLNCKKMNVCWVSHPGYGVFLQRLELTKTSPKR